MCFHAQRVGDTCSRGNPICSTPKHLGGNWLESHRRALVQTIQGVPGSWPAAGHSDPLVPAITHTDPIEVRLACFLVVYARFNRHACASAAVGLGVCMGYGCAGADARGTGSARTRPQCGQGGWRVAVSVHVGRVVLTHMVSHGESWCCSVCCCHMCWFLHTRQLDTK